MTGTDRDGFWDVVVVGAGAAGLWCAWRAAALGCSVLVLEKTARTGTKILASGGTRCNLTTTLDGRGAARLFGSRGERFLRHAMRVLPPTAVREAFDGLGVPTVEAPLEKIFPKSQRARDVRDALESAGRTAGAQFRLGAGVAKLHPEGAGWRVWLDGADSVLARRLVLAVGGQSYARTGTTGDGYRWLAELGLSVATPVPALVPLVSPADWVRSLAGIAAQEVEVRHGDGRDVPLASRRRPVVFSHAGLSGPGAMDLAEPVARAALDGRTRELLLDFLPDIAAAELERALVERASKGGQVRVVRALEEHLAEPLPRRLLAAVLAQAAVHRDDLVLAQLSKPQRQGLVRALKGLVVPVSGTTGYDNAEVTAGGLALDEVDPGSARVKSHPGLYAVGELLDLQGPIGGLNFQAAFAMGEVAAAALAASRAG